MKRILAFVCLFALLLAGCAKKEAPEQTPVETTEATVATTTELPEQIVVADESPLVGNWEATMDKGQYAALLYFLQTGGDEEYAMTWLTYMTEVTYPLQVTMEIGSDNTYMYTLHPDTDGAGLEEFSLSLYNGMVGYFMQMNNMTEDAAKDYMADNGTALWDINSKIKELNMDKLFINSEMYTGTWEQNDKGLFLSGWCTIQFALEEDTMEWTECDDEDLNQYLPLSFVKQ